MPRVLLKAMRSLKYSLKREGERGREKERGRERDGISCSIIRHNAATVSLAARVPDTPNTLYSLPIAYRSSTLGTASPVCAHSFSSHILNMQPLGCLQHQPDSQHQHRHYVGSSTRCSMLLQCCTLHYCHLPLSL